MKHLLSISIAAFLALGLIVQDAEAARLEVCLRVLNLASSVGLRLLIEAGKGDLLACPECDGEQRPHVQLAWQRCIEQDRSGPLPQGLRCQQPTRLRGGLVPDLPAHPAHPFADQSSQGDLRLLNRGIH